MLAGELVAADVDRLRQQVEAVKNAAMKIGQAMYSQGGQ